jgi:hypothetical protein
VWYPGGKWLEGKLKALIDATMPMINGTGKTEKIK